jgi:hypothetical protein
MAEDRERGEQLEISEFAAALAQRGASKGGYARAAKLSPEERSEIARRGAQAKWARQQETGLTSEELAKLPRATHVGELVLGDTTIECAVLEDGRRVLSQRSVGKALGRRHGGRDWRVAREAGDGSGRLPIFLVAENLKSFISNELRVMGSTPILYRPLHGGKVASGIDATALPKICDVWLKARDAGVLRQKRQQRIAAKAEVLMRGLAHVGIIALVDEATGYQEERDRDALHRILAAYISEELMPWTRRFPDTFYEELFRLQGWQYRPPSVKRPRQVGKLTAELVYQQLPPGVLDELRAKNPMVKPGYRRHKHQQFLTENIGNVHLEKQLIAVTTLMRAAPDLKTFKLLFKRAFPGPQRPLELVAVGEGEADEAKGSSASSKA